jgi:hypothetical protein
MKDESFKRNPEDALLAKLGSKNKVEMPCKDEVKSQAPGFRSELRIQCMTTSNALPLGERSRCLNIRLVKLCKSTPPILVGIYHFNFESNSSMMSALL